MPRIRLILKPRLCMFARVDPGHDTVQGGHAFAIPPPGAYGATLFDDEAAADVRGHLLTSFPPSREQDVVAM
eukprot:12916246-Prorocentrum_lima.AAC.1